MSNQPSFDTTEFRKALGCFTTGVTIITARTEDGQPIGLTANSFNSVSLNPPLVLWSLAKTSHNLEAFEKTKHWAVHILSASQEALSGRFARRGEDKFAGVETEPGIGDVPLLSGCTACLQCRTSFMHDGGDHVIFVGEVLDFVHTDAPPLVFHAGKYAVATPRSPQLSLNSRPAEVSTGFDEDFLGYLLGRAHFDFHMRLREQYGKHGLSDAENYMLFALSARGKASIGELNDLISFVGHEIGRDDIRSMEARDLIRYAEGEGGVLCWLSDHGRTVALDIIAGAKAVESDVLDRLGYWNAVSLKNLLKLLIVSADTGVPHPWDAPEDR